MSADISAFISNFTTAVDFQEAVEIGAETKLADLPEWDSLAALGVIVMCDMEYGVTITGNDLKNCTSIQDVFGLIAQKKS
jgi:acyl carrier protein